MSWYTYVKISSARDDKTDQVIYLRDKLEEAIDQAMIGGDESINLIDRLIDRLEGAKGFRNLIPKSVKDNVLSLMQKAREVKKDSPHKFCAYLEEALTYL